MTKRAATSAAAPSCVLDPGLGFVSHALYAGALIIVVTAIGFVSDCKLVLGNVNY
jgi:hypothetical protein